MATVKRKITGYIPEDLWVAFREGCLQHKRSASAQLGVLIAQQVDQWTGERLREQREPSQPWDASDA